MIRFDCDYAQGAHPAILKRMNELNFEHQIPYGEDEYSQNARKLIKKIANAPNSEVHFFVGGTQTNTTVIYSILRPHQGVIAVESGHINVHESGAIENTGHKVIALPTTDGKIKAEQIEQVCQAHKMDVNHEHMVQPGMVYISQPTEIGSLYSIREIEEISSVCKRCEIPLYVDGARLGYALAADSNNVSLADLARLTDIFYIGGTKVGALFGEALVINNPKLGKDFRYFIKQRGGLLAKGWLIGLQFETLFYTNYANSATGEPLYLDISRHAIEMAKKLKSGFESCSYSFLYDSPTNQQFPILPDKIKEDLSCSFGFGFWEKLGDNRTAFRFCTHWGTKEEEINMLISKLKEL